MCTRGSGSLKQSVLKECVAFVLQPMDSSQKSDIDDLFTFNDKGTIILQRKINYERELIRKYQLKVILIEVFSYALVVVLTVAKRPVCWVNVADLSF